MILQVTNCSLFSNPGSNDKRTLWTFLPTGNPEQDSEQSFGLKRQESFKSGSGLLGLSKTNFTSKKAEKEIIRKEEIKKRQAEKKRKKSRDSMDKETPTSVLCEMGCEE